jgi:hypothetical protein
MVSLKVQGFEIRLEVVPVETLLLHEETFPQLVNRLTFEFTNWANLQNPIIVDEKHIVLDGNHRAYVFKKLKFKYISVCKIDYFNQDIKLRYWFRLLERVKGLDPIKRIIEEMNGSIQQVPSREALVKILEENRLIFGIQQGTFFWAARFSKDIVHDAVSAYGALGAMQDKLLHEGAGLQYIPCQYAHERRFFSRLRDNEIVVWTPHITKRMVVEAASRGKIFAPRSTRHIIYPRPLNVNVPTYWFKEDISLDEINEKFSRFLEGKGVKRFGPGQVINGRYYGEEVCIFYDKPHKHREIKDA